MSSENKPLDFPEFDAQSEREVIISKLKELIEESHYQATEGRVHDATNERVRQDWHRETTHTAKVLLKFMDSLDKEDLDERLKEIERVQGKV